MTWTKLGSEFFDDCAEAGLSDAAVRTHSEAIGYLYGQENFDLTLKKSTMRRWAGSTQAEQAAEELVGVKYWAELPNEWVVVHHADIIRQSLTAQITKRENDKLDKRRKRSPRSSVGTDVAADVGTDVLATQTDRQTNSRSVEQATEVTNDETGEVAGWPPVAAVPVSGPVCPAAGCSTRLVGLEKQWGYCRTHKRDAA